MTAVILIVCGPPAVGKTTLCKALERYLNQSAIHIEYDKLVDYSVSKKENSLAIQSIIRQYSDKDYIILDDTFHLKSMRKAVCFAGCTVVTLRKRSNDNLIERNKNRAHIVDEKYLLMEFEEPSDCIYVDDCYEICDLIHMIDVKAKIFQEKQKEKQMALVRKENDRKITMENSIHNINIELNRKVTELIRLDPSKKEEILSKKKELFKKIKSGEKVGEIDSKLSGEIDLKVEEIVGEIE